MRPREFQILWALHTFGDKPRPASDIAVISLPRAVDGREVVPSLRALEARGFIERDDSVRRLRWGLTDRAREWVSA